MAHLMLVNPKRRKRKGRKARRAKRNANPFQFKKKRRSRRRGNVANFKKSRRRSRRSSGFGGFTARGLIGTVQASVKSAGYAAVGAVALDVVWAYLPIPDTLRTGMVRHVAKAAGAVALGMVAEKFLGRDTGKLIGGGAMTVVLYNVARELLGTVAPTLRLAGMADDYPELAYLNPAAIESDGMGMYQDNGLGMYQEADFDSANM